MMDLQSAAFGLIFLGIILVFIGIALLAIGSLGSGEWGGGLVIFIGPFPIAIGGGKLGRVALLIAVLLAIAMFLIMFLGYRVGKLS